MRVVPAARDGFDMWLFNYNAISNFLICVLLVIMVGYLLFRSQRNREVLSLILFMAHLLVWQACLLYQNLYFDPAAALPLFYFQHSGYTLLSFLALVMFSYVFIEPVFATEARVVFFAGLLAGFVIIIHFFVSVLPVPPQMRFDVALHVYSASPAGIRPYIIALELMFLAIYAKNMVYKSIRMRGESRLFAIHVAVATLAGAVLIMGGVVLEGAGAVDPRFMQGANTVLAGIVFIYFYWVYINFSRMRYFYADKTFLTIIFIVIIAISLTTALTYGIYRDSYVADRREDARNIVTALDSRAISDAGAYFEELHKADLDFISVRDNATGAERSLFGTLYHFEGRGVDARGAGSERPAPVFASYGATVLFYFTLQGGARTVWTGFSYVAYRAHMHRFVAAGLTTIVLVVFGLFALLRVAIYFGLTRPLRRLLRGIEEIHAGNLYHEIDVNTFDEIGYISQQFNYMVYDLRVTEESIKRSEQKYREIMAMLPDIIYETDLSLRITYLNEAGRRITGYAEDDVHAGVSMTELLDESDTGALRALLAAAPARRSVEFITHRIRRKDGSVFYGENNSVVIDEMGRPAGLRGVIRDVTERLRLERSLLQAQKMKTIGSLAGGIAHDFNNILAGITGTVSLLEYKLAGSAALRPEEIGDDLRIMKTTADRAAKMVRQILALSRMQTPTLALTDLNAVLRHVLDVCKNSFDKKIELDFTFHEGAAYATADETQLEQVVLNLCVNARDAMTIMRPAGSAAGGRIVVRLEHSFPDEDPFSPARADADAAYWCISVADAGVGMDNETLARVFDPFFTTKEKDKGTGLGLPMVYNIVKQHGGFVDISSEPEKGTVCRVYLPIARPEPEASREERAPEGLHFGSGTILLVDDDGAIQKTAEEMLRALGYGVILARDGREGVEVLRARADEIDAVILDVVMPVMSGHEAFAQMRALVPDLRVLVSSGFRDDPRIEEILSAGARGFIQKPYTLRQLSVELHRIVQME
ncbi:MAG TPA: PAS domain S-box protein [Spirochaetota bacterium]|nr:PAS domain S-box protein [Spirochaetota bacterium]HNT12366.1 PAS domain S-box protein [Spirochaetota bacterium]